MSQFSLHQKYTVEEKIGEGGFGDVFRARRRADNFEVAVKMLHHGAGIEERRRFEREVRLLEAQQHPNIVKILDHDLTAERPYYAMRLMRIGAITKLAGRLSFDVVRGVLRTLVDVLATLHVNGGIHRDIKPDNVLVDADGQVAVCDFGLGNSPKCTVKFTMHAAGTVGYAAPELFMPGGTASQAADVFSLGATIFHLLTDVRPTMTTHLDPGAHVPTVPSDLRDLVLQMVRRDPAERPTAASLCEALGLPTPRPYNAPAPQPEHATAATGGFTPRRSATTIGGGRYG